MKLLSTVLTAAACLTLANADSSNMANDWNSVLAGDSTACSDLAVLFSRGTFDPGNIGPWVGVPLQDALKAKHSSVAFQGLNETDYAADLAGYLDGGPDGAARALASYVNSYATTCPDAKIAISGWSQGALIIHKSLAYLTAQANAQLIAFVPFGDPAGLFTDTESFVDVPANTKSIPFCNSSPTDPLCGSALNDFPHSITAVIPYLEKVWNEVDQANMNDAQKAAVESLIVQLPLQASEQLEQLAKDILHGRLQRWMLTPEHFLYGMDGSTDSAAEQIVALVA